MTSDSSEEAPLAAGARLNRFRGALVCPDCRAPLADAQAALVCAQCKAQFGLDDGILKIWPASRRAELEESLAHFRSRHSGLRENPFFRALLPPSPLCDPQRERRHSQVAQAMVSGLVLNLGSKDSQWSGHIINLDLVRPAKKNGSPEIDLLADIQHLPFSSNSVDGIICTYVLEHVADARACIDEIHRVLKPGGHVYVTVPFLFPTHPDPLDRWRWTLDGLRHAMRGFTEINAGGIGGAFSTLVAVVPALAGSIFSNFYLFNALRCFLGWILWPLKFFDHIAGRSDKSFMTASNFYFFGRKR